MEGCRGGGPSCSASGASASDCSSPTECGHCLRQARSLDQTKKYRKATCHLLQSVILKSICIQALARKSLEDNATREFAGSAWEALRHIRQAVDFLVISLKPMRTLREALSIQQLERIVSIYWDDVNGTNTISAEFTSSLKTAAREESNTVTTFSILLDDDSSIPFSLDDITKTLPAIGVADDDLLPFVHENPNFAFLLQRGE